MQLAGDSGETVTRVETTDGPGRFFVAAAVEPRAHLFLGHGAGGGVDAADLVDLDRGLPDHGITVVRFEQPWRTAGGRIATRPPRLDQAWNEALAAVFEHRIALPGVDVTRPLFVGGRSAGARVACRTSGVGLPAGRPAGVVVCAFPLHPPGRPERSRILELLAPRLPRLVLQGDRDPFGGPDELMAALDAGTAEDLPAAVRDEPAAQSVVQVVRVPGADHSMRLKKSGPITPAERQALLVGSVLGFVDGVVGRTIAGG